jgi:hypothetical protein
MTHILAFALGLLVGAFISWLAARRIQKPEPLEFEDLIRDARKRCGCHTGLDK